MAAADFIVDVHHHFMPPLLFDRLANLAGGKRIVTNEISLTLHPSRKDLESHIRCMDEAGITVSILTDQIQVMDLRLTVQRSTAQTPALTGLEALRQLQKQGVISAALVQRAQTEGEAMVQQLQQGGVP